MERGQLHEPQAVASLPRLFVGQVPTDKAEADLAPVFEGYGPIEKVTLVRGPDGKSRGCAMVQFKRWADAEAAMQAVHGTSPLEGGKGRPLVVHFANPRRTMGSQAAENAIAPRKLFVGQIPKTAGEAEVAAVFAPYGEVQSISILKSKGIHAGCAFVQYATWSACEAAIEALHERLVMPGCEHALVVKFADAKKADAPPHQRGLGLMGGMGLGALMGGPHPALLGAPGYEHLHQHLGHLHMAAVPAHLAAQFGAMSPMAGMLQGSPLGPGGMGIPTPLPYQSSGLAGGVDNGSSDSLLAETTTVEGSGTPGGSGPATASEAERAVNRIGSTPTLSSNGSGGNLQAMAVPPHVAAGLGMLQGYVGAENGVALLGGGLMAPHLALGRGAIKLGRGVSDPAAYLHKLFIGQIPHAAAEQDLWALFSPVGDILELAILRSQGRSKGCAFLTYASRAQALAAIAAFNGRLVAHNKKLVVKFADQKAAAA